MDISFCIEYYLTSINKRIKTEVDNYIMSHGLDAVPDATNKKRKRRSLQNTAAEDVQETSLELLVQGDPIGPAYAAIQRAVAQEMEARRSVAGRG